MSLPPSSLRTFLSTAKTSLASAIAGGKQVNIVVGNESADLDSITSSVVYAYLRSLSPSPHGALYIPLLNIPASDIRIRPELLALLPHANIEVKHFITLDDLPPLSSTPIKLKPELTRWVLVDHNVLQGRLGELYSQRVFGCVDHHVDEQRIQEDEHDPRVITKTGSCQSLVVNHFRDAWDNLSTSSSSSTVASGQSDATVGLDDAAVRYTWDMQLAKFALASILMDTSNLRSEDKVEEDDRHAVQYLENKIHLARQGARFDRDGFFREINTAKKDIGYLSLPEILRKDYKQWTEKGKTLGISSIVKPLSFLISKGSDEQFFKDLDSYAHERGLAMLVLMTTSTSSAGEFQRELLIRAVDSECEHFLGEFEASAREDIRLDSSHDFGMSQAGPATKVWWQRDLGKSRKQVAPLLRAVMNE